MSRQWSYPTTLPDGTDKVMGHLTPYPRVGDRFILPSGEVGEFIEVSEQKSNPKDLYYATVRSVDPPQEPPSEPTKDSITIHYPWQPASKDHLGRQHDGALCKNIEWHPDQGTTETWQLGKFDPQIYPPLEKTPFQIWQKPTP